VIAVTRGCWICALDEFYFAASYKLKTIYPSLQTIGRSGNHTELTAKKGSNGGAICPLVEMEASGERKRNVLGKQEQLKYCNFTMK